MRAPFFGCLLTMSLHGGEEGSVRARPRVRESMSSGLSSCSYKDTNNAIMRASVSWSHLTPITSQRPSLPNTIILEVRVCTYALRREGDTTQCAAKPD